MQKKLLLLISLLFISSSLLAMRESSRKRKRLVIDMTDSFLDGSGTETESDNGSETESESECEEENKSPKKRPRVEIKSEDQSQTTQARNECNGNVILQLMLAIKSNNIKKVMELIQELRSLNFKIKSRKNLIYLIHVATANGNLDIVKILCERGAIVTLKDKFGQTALGVAKRIHPDNKELIEYLSERKDIIFSRVCQSISKKMIF